MTTAVTVTRPSACTPHDVALLHRQHCSDLRSALRAFHVRPADLDDAYIETMVLVLERGPDHYDAAKASLITYANWQARRVATDVHRRNAAQQAREISTDDVLGDDKDGQDLLDMHAAKATYSAVHAPATESDSESLIAVQQFLAALRADLRAPVRALLDVAGLDVLQSTQADHEQYAERLGVSACTIRRHIREVKEQTREIWPDFFDSAAPTAA